MSAIVVDTDVLSFQIKGDSRARLYRRHLAGRRWILSFQTVAELEWWAVQKRWGISRREQLEQYLRSVQVYWFDRDLCRNWAEIFRRARRKARPITPSDAWIAATAMTLGIPLLTNNPADYAGADGVTVLSEASHRQ